MRKHFIALLFLSVFSVSVMAQFTPKVTPIKTPWTDKVDKNNPLPEYPRPQLVRTDWMNLNGYWEFKSGAAGDVVPVNQSLGGQIVVPFAPEATLSGVVKHDERVWYRKLFTVPTAWTGKRVLIHFGAIDWESEVYVNGVSMGIHKGGYDEITYDITDKLIGTGQQEIIVRVYDPTRDFGQPRGKQTTAPGGIMYTCVTGIWQTVWLEPVAQQNIATIKITPDIDNNVLKLTVNSPNGTGLTVKATAKDASASVGSVSGAANTELIIPVPNAKLWSPESPFLYDLDIKLMSGNVVVDSVSSYFGMRKITMVRETPTPQLYLNNKAVYMMGPLDQGFWPDGIYTAPTDEALKSDIEAEKALGFNMVRKHIKVEPQRWYYWADKLGIMVWQDMPSPNSYDAPSGMAIEKAQFDTELTRMINTHYNSPSIVTWVIFNEWQAEFESPRHTLMVRALDPTRLINQGSGHERAEEQCDMFDVHYYPHPSCDISTTHAVVCGEYGGIGLAVSGHLWSTAGNPYGNAGNADGLVNIYSGYLDMLLKFKKDRGMSAAVYTEITDVESEINGFMTYDRTWKVDPDRIKVLNEKIINDNVSSAADVLPTSNVVAQTWKYTTNTPASTWNTPTFDDSSWASAVGGFGSLKDANGNQIGTLWNTTTIWIRKTFTVGNLTPTQIKNMKMSVFHDENCVIYINGELAASLSGYTTGYVNVEISTAAKNAIKINDVNTIAIRCIQTTGGQYIDAGLSYMTLTSDDDNNLKGAVTAYSDCDYANKAARIDVGEYTLSKLQALGLANDDISSLKIASGFKVQLFADDNFAGSMVELTSSSACLSSISWDNKVSSLKVIPNGVTGLKGIFTIQNKKSGMNMEVYNSGLTNGTNVQQNTATQATNQQFIVTHQGNGVYKIMGVQSLKLLDVNDLQIVDSANVQIWQDGSSPDQQFILVDAGDSCYKMVALYSGRVIDVALGSTSARANVQTYVDNNQESAQWKFTPATVSEDGDGLLCRMYNGMNFENMAGITKHPKVDFNWGNGNADPMLKADKTSMRWTGQIKPNYSEKYTFYIDSDNGRRLWINNQLVIDKWISDWGTEYSGTIDLEAGKKYDIKVEYFEEIGGASIRLRWSCPSQIKQIVPQANLFSNSIPTV
ncbi:MAG TPA: PA14 domain-containing protein, partial [Paludibacter sp.]